MSSTRAHGRPTDQRQPSAPFDGSGPKGPAPFDGSGREGPAHAPNGERRDQAATRMSYEALVEVGARSIGGFEAESVDLSPDGIRLRTAYLPNVGERIACRFDGFGGEIVVHGDVAWSEDAGRGGEFGVRFTSMSPEAMALLREMCKPAPAVALPEPSDSSAALPGSRVRLHIQGLGSPMRARVRDVARGEVLIGSNLEFLRVGRNVELEEVDHKRTRVANIEHVSVDVDPETNVPQLVVALSYRRVGEADECAAVSAADQDLTTAPYRVRRGPRADEPPVETTPEPTVIHDGDEPEDEGLDVAPASARGDTLRAERRVRPPAEVRRAILDEEEIEEQPRELDEEHDARRTAMTGMAARAAASVGVMAKKLGPRLALAGMGAKGALGKMLSAIRKQRHQRKEERERTRQVKRTTAPPPSGALRSDGRRLVRDARDARSSEPPPLPDDAPSRSNKKRAIFGAALGVMMVSAIYVAASNYRDRSATPQADSAVAAAPAEPAAAQPETAEGAVATANVPLFGTTPLSTTEPVPVPPNLDAKGEPVADAAGDGDDAKAEGGGKGDKKEEAAAEKLSTEWGFGQVVNPTTFRLKMDGKVDGIVGTENASGFVVTVPGRKSISSAEGLAKRDKRIASVNVVNFPDRAEITFKFKDEVPAFVAKAAGKRLVIDIDTPNDKDKDKKQAKTQTAANDGADDAKKPVAVDGAEDGSSTKTSTPKKKSVSAKKSAKKKQLQP